MQDPLSTELVLQSWCLELLLTVWADNGGTRWQIGEDLHKLIAVATLNYHDFWVALGLARRLACAIAPDFSWHYFILGAYCLCC